MTAKFYVSESMVEDNDHQLYLNWQEEFAPQLAPSKGPSSVDPETAGRLKKRPPPNVRISAWRLAKLDAQEASQAAQKAREKSNVLQKVGHRDLMNVPETDNSSSSNISSRSGLSMDYALKRAMQKGPDKSLTPHGIPSLNSDLSRTSTAKMPVLSVLPLEAAEGDSEALSSIDSHSVTSTIPDSMSMSPLPAERRYSVSERPYSIAALGMRGALGEPLPSNSTAAVPSAGGRSSWPAYQGSSVSNTPTVGRTYVPSWGASSGLPDSVVSSTRGRNTFLRDLRRNPVFWSRPGLGRFGGDTSDVGRTPSRIVFGGSGISTSTYASQVLRHGSSIRNPVAHSDASDGDIASESGHESVSTSMSPSTSGLHTSPALSRQLKPSGDFSIFNGAPILPVGDGKVNRKESSHPPPRKPPLNPKTEVQRPLGVIIPRSQSPKSS
jgi:palmitoyltransferase